MYYFLTFHVWYNVIVCYTGATAISKLLMNNCVIQELKMRFNAIGNEGACLILQSAVKNETYQGCIDVDDEYRRDIEVWKLINILEKRRRKMKKIMVGYYDN